MGGGTKAAETIIVLMRHGQTEHNHKGIFQGRLDAKLDSTGIRQAHEAARALASGLLGRTLDAIYTSPLSRAAHTADIVSSALGTPAYRMDELREIDCGLISGLSVDEARLRFPVEMDRFSDGWWTRKYPKGQSHADYEREDVIPALRKLISIHRGGTVLTVTHGGFIRTAVLNCMGFANERPFLNQRLDNCGFTTIAVPGDGSDTPFKGRLLEFNLLLSAPDMCTEDVYTKEAGLR